MKTELQNSALMLIGFQNDYFSEDGVLHSVIEQGVKAGAVLENTLSLLKNKGEEFGLVVSTPIVFTPDYQELVDPVGVLKTIKESGAFQKDSFGGATINEFKEFSQLIQEVPGKQGLNAFSNTGLLKLLRDNDIDQVVLAGVVTSLCIDSTGRHAVDNDLKVLVLSDCTSGRSEFEQAFYCEQIFPLYANVQVSTDL
jgi:nicotinamidase-related amidase